MGFAVNCHKRRHTLVHSFATASKCPKMRGVFKAALMVRFKCGLAASCRDRGFNIFFAKFPQFSL